MRQATNLLEPPVHDLLLTWVRNFGSVGRILCLTIVTFSRSKRKFGNPSRFILHIMVIQATKELFFPMPQINGINAFPTPPNAQTSS